MRKSRLLDSPSSERNRVLRIERDDNGLVVSALLSEEEELRRIACILMRVKVNDATADCAD